MNESHINERLRQWGHDTVEKILMDESQLGPEHTERKRKELLKAIRIVREALGDKP